ncbi:MAG: phosphoribosylformylglycinamidine synthase subunit PurS [bacterium]
MITAKIHITLKKGILDPQGKTVHHALENLGFKQIHEVRMGKLIQLKFNEVSKQEAEHLTIAACKKLLANPVIEDFNFELIAENSEAKKDTSV